MANSLTDSEAVMLERCSEVGLPTSASARLKAQGVNTLSKLAYALRPPGESPSEDEIKSLIREGSADPPLGSVAALRRLIFESQTLMTAQVRNMIEHKDEEKRELPAAERAERVKQQKQLGLQVSGSPVNPNAPTHRTMLWPPWFKTTSSLTCPQQSSARGRLSCDSRNQRKSWTLSIPP